VKERLKEPREGSERDPKTLCLQAVEPVFIQGPRTFCRTVRRVMQFGKVKVLSTGAEAKASLKRASSQIA
jgi:hypothetical protein